MKEQRITIDIAADGTLHADAEGFSGDACVKDLERLLESLGSVDGIVRKPRLPDADVLAHGQARATVGRKP